MSKKLKSEEHEFPEDNEGRVSSILNIVNNDVRNVLLMHLDDTPREPKEVRSLVKSTIGRSIRIPQESTFNSYLLKVLFPIGAVAKQEVIREYPDMVVVGYRLTQAGRIYGRPFAALSLEYAVDNNISMNSILGPTQSSGRSRSPVNRTKILARLNQNGETSLIDIEENLDIPVQSALNHLKALQKIGFVDWSSCGELLGQTEFVYQWAGGDLGTLEPIYGTRQLPSRICEVLKEIGEADALTLLEKLRCEDYDSRRSISMMLPGLEEQGFLKRKKWRGSRSDPYKSEVRLSPPGQKFIKEFYERLVDGLNNGDSLTDSEKLYSGFQSDGQKLQEYSRTAVELYRATTKNMDKRPIRETQDEIMAFIRDHPGMRPSELTRAFDRKLDRYFHPMVKSGEIRVEKEGKISRYYAGN